MARIIVGYLVTLPDGYECRLGPDYTRALHYAAQQHGKIEAMFVERRDKDEDAED
jgi:hypothetical protein